MGLIKGNYSKSKQAFAADLTWIPSTTSACSPLIGRIANAALVIVISLPLKNALPLKKKL
jgi:hypothetical protein